MKLIAESVLGIAVAQLAKHSFTRPAPEAAPDLVEAREAVAALAEFLPKLRWSGNAPPKSVGTWISQEDVEAFADSTIVFSSEATAILGTPDSGHGIAGPQSGLCPERPRLPRSTLAYWYAKANGQSSERIAAIDAALKERGTTPNALFARATR